MDIPANSILGFSGTKDGLTPLQIKKIKWYILHAVEFHHGDDKGADKDAHIIAINVRQYIDGNHIPWIVVHPPENEYRRAFCDGDVILEKKPFLVRNHDIVDACEILIVCPNGYKEILRSGTWATWRYAKRVGIPWIIIYPDGSIEESWNDAEH